MKQAKDAVIHVGGKRVEPITRLPKEPPPMPAEVLVRAQAAGEIRSWSLTIPGGGFGDPVIVETEGLLSPETRAALEESVAWNCGPTKVVYRDEM